MGKLSLTQRWIFNSLFSTHITVLPSRMFQPGTSLRHSPSISKKETESRCQSGPFTIKQPVSRTSPHTTQTGSTSEQRLESPPSESTTDPSKETEPAPSTADSPPENASDTFLLNSREHPSLVKSLTKPKKEEAPSSERPSPRRVLPTWTELLPKSPRTPRP